jgi:hypothetical protein
MDNWAAAIAICLRWLQYQNIALTWGNFMSAIEVIFLGISVLSLVLFVSVVIFYKYFRTYTREKFAFRVFLLIASLCINVVLILLAPKSTVGIIIEITNYLFGIHLPDAEPSFSDKALAIFIIGLLVYLALSLYRDWPGNISVREHDARFGGNQPNLVANAFAAVVHRKSPSLQPYAGPKRQLDKFEQQLSPTESKAWHIWVARILSITSHQFHIDEVKDWYSDRKLFISRYGPKNIPIGILCCSSFPTPSAVENAVEFVTSQTSLPSRLIVAIELGSENKYSTALNGISIEYRFRNEMLDGLVDFSTYKNDIKFRYELAEIAEGYSLKLPDVYVACAATALISTGKEEIEDVEQYVSNWANEKSLRHLAILGEYGQGKSVLALKITHRLLFDELKNNRIPVLITLGGRSPRNQKKLGLLADWAASYDINPRALLALHEAGRLLLIFDGFDEMDLVGEASLRLEHFRSLWEFSSEREAKIMITGRPNFFLDQVERERSLNIRAQSFEVPYTEAIYISHLDIPRIRQALRNFDANVSGDILNALTSNQAASSFRDLMSRPSTLFLAANIWEDIRHSDDPSRVNSAEVIGRFIQHSYDRQQRKGLPEFLSNTEREYFTLGVAIAMLRENQYSNHLTSTGLQKAITRLLDGFPEELETFGSAVDAERIPLRERLQDRELLIETISTDVRSCGVIVSDLSQSDAFKFAHKSFFELLLAKNLVFSLFVDTEFHRRLQIVWSGYAKREHEINRAVIKASGIRSIATVAPITTEVEVFAAETVLKIEEMIIKNAKPRIFYKMAPFSYRLRLMASPLLLMNPQRKREFNVRSQVGKCAFKMRQDSLRIREEIESKRATPAGSAPSPPE